MTLPIFIDIDGTLTDLPTKMWGKVHDSRLAQIRRLIAQGREIVIWSGGGTVYARDFAARHGLAGVTCIGKPTLIVDDNPTIRPKLTMRVVSPEDYFKL